MGNFDNRTAELFHDAQRAWPPNAWFATLCSTMTWILIGALLSHLASWLALINTDDAICTLRDNDNNAKPDTETNADQIFFSQNNIFSTIEYIRCD